MNKNKFILYLFSIGLVIGCFPIHSQKDGLNETMHIRIGKKTILVEIADNPRKRAIGLMHRKSLPKDRGMLFVFPEEDYLSFWMKNTLVPLSIGYFDSNGVLNEIYDMKPNQTEITYPSRKKAIYALEVNQGWFRENGISIGQALVLEIPVTGR